MVGNLLARGMLIGILAGLVAFGVARMIGEAPIEHAIAFETQMEQAHSHAHAAGVGAEPEEETVSRAVQSGIGLLAGLTVYGAAIGGFLALVYAGAGGRAGMLGPRGLAATLAVLGFTAVVLVPGFKYPANPPAVGDPGTIGQRTALFFTMLALSTSGMVAAVVLARRLAPRRGTWNAGIGGAALFLGLMIVADLVLPDINEVPAAFPASVLWHFRMAGLAVQATLWATLGLGFGWLCEARPLGRTPLQSAKVSDR